MKVAVKDTRGRLLLYGTLNVGNGPADCRSCT